MPFVNLAKTRVYCKLIFSLQVRLCYKINNGIWELSQCNIMNLDAFPPSSSPARKAPK